MSDYPIVNHGDVENVAPKLQMRIKLDDEVHELRPWDILRIGPGWWTG
jgi:hypothetical protein